MAIIPRYEPDQVGTRPVSQPQMSGASPVAGALANVGGTLQGMSQEGFAVLRHERDKAMAAELSGAQGDFAASMTDALYNEKTGLMYRMGKEAQQPDPNDPNKSLPGMFDEEMKKRIGEIRSKLHPDIQPYFDKFVQAQLDHGHVQITNHAISETRRYNSERNKAAVGTYIDAAAKNPDPVDGITTYWPLVERTILAQAAMDHIPSELTQSQLAAAQSTMYRGAIENMRQKNPAGAYKFFTDHKDMLDAKDAEHIETMLKPAVMAQKAAASAETAWTKYGPRNPHDAIDLNKMEEEVRAANQDDPEAADAAVSRLRIRVAGWNETVRTQDDANEATVWKFVRDGEDPTAIYNSKEYGALPGDRQLKVKEHIDQKARQKVLEDRAEKRAARSEARAELLLQKELQKPAQHELFWRYSQPEVLGKMTDNQIANLYPTLGVELTDRLMALKKKVDSPEKQHAAKIDDDIFKALAAQAGYPVYSNSKGDKVKMGELRLRVDDAIDAAERRKGSPLTRQEKEAEMKRQMILVPTEGRFYGTNDTPLYQLKPGDKVVMPKTWGDVPKKVRDQIKEVFAAKGRRFNEADGLKYYGLLIQ